MTQPPDPNPSHVPTTAAPTTAAPSQTPLRSKRRPKLSARYLSYVHKADNDMHHDDPSSDDATVTPSNTHLPPNEHFIHSNQPSDVQTTAPSSPYDADEEDEGERDVHAEENAAKRRRRSLSRTPAKHSRRVNGRRTLRTNSSNLVRELKNIPSLGTTSIKHSDDTLPTSPKRSQSAHPKDCDEPVTILHTEPDIPGIKLWDHHNKVLVSEKVLPSELGKVLRNNKHYAIYVGQDETYIKYPAAVLDLTTPANRQPWMKELRKPSVERRVMFIDPRSAKLLAPRKCPNLDELSSFLEELRNERSKEVRRRVFNAHYTDSLGFTQQRWQSMFAVPPPVSLITNTTTSHIPPSTPSHPPRRTLRQMKSVQYTEAPSDAAEFQSSESDISIAEPLRNSNETVSRVPSRLSNLSSPSTSGSEDSDVQAGHNVNGRNPKPRIYQDIFPITSSSEYERAEVSEILSREPSSDDFDEAKHVDAGTSSAEGDVVNGEKVSPASVLVLNRTPTLRLQKLYTFHESSTSDDSLCEVLDGNCLDGVHGLDTALSSDPTNPSQSKLRLQLSNRSESDAQTFANKSQSAHGNVGDSLSGRFGVGEPLSGPHGENEVPVERSEEHDKKNKCSQDKARDNHTPTVPRQRRVREVPSTALENVARNADVTGCQGTSGDERLERDSNGISDLSRTYSIRNRKRLGIGAGPSTNEKLGNLDAKKGERAEGKFRKSLHDSGTSKSSRAHVITTRSREASRCQPLPPKDPAHTSITRRRKTANAKGLQSYCENVRDNTKASDVEEPSFPTTRAGGTNITPRGSVALSEEVYLWDLETKKRSDTLIPLAAALKFCASNCLTMIYDGQDIKSGDQRFGKLWNETKAWVSRKGTRPPMQRRVRVWDHCTGTIEKYCFSPSMYNVETWLRSNPDNSLFRPSLYVQYEHRPPFKEFKNPGSSVRSRVKQAIQSQVLDRIKHLRVTQLSEGPQRQVILWNILKRKCDPPRDFASRSHLTRFLFSNPALELFCGQDELLRLEHSTELKLIHVTKECPAEYVRFWDTRSKETCLRPKEGDSNDTKTIHECINAEPWLKIYFGQERPITERIRIMMVLPSLKGSSLGSLYTLTQCGRLLQSHVFSQGWVPRYIETQKECASCTSFWSKSQKTLSMEASNTGLLSVEDYLNSSPDLEVYIGQDLAMQVQEQLQKWFQILRYEPGTDVNKAVPVLLRHNLVPLKYRAIRFTSGDEFKVQRVPVKRQKRRRQEAQASETKDDPSTRDKKTSVKRQRLSLRVHKRAEDERDHHVSVSSFSEEEELLEDGRAEDTAMTRARSQDTTNYEEERLDGSSGPRCTPTPSNSTFDSGYSESGSESDTGICTEGDASMHLPEDLPDVEDHIRSATKSAKKMICVIREAGPKVLKRELMHDVRQNLREQLILEVESIQHLVALVKDFSSYDFASVANELCEELQLLDVHGCFSCSAELGYTPNDLSSVREDLGTGRICTSYGVIRKFREVCAGLIQFHDGTLLQGQAALLRFYGEEAIAKFQKSHSFHLEREQQMLRIFSICERAKQIGFRTGQRSRKSKNMSNSLPLGSSEPSLRVSGRQPEVTFLNYRDEKGNSVMGKRPSVRVFGFTIDTKVLEESIENITPCHVCGKDAILSLADSMRCTNHIFNLCDEVVCRECLETIFSLEQNEFKVIRDSENWFCVHCRGLCPSGSECMKSVASKATPGPTTKTHFKFVWPYAPLDSAKVAVVVSKRRRNGEYEPFPESQAEDKVDLVQDPSDKNWFTFLDLEIGAYRCQVITDNVWMASTTFHVLPSPADSVSAHQLARISTIPETTVSYLKGPHPFRADESTKLAARTRPRGPRIRWHAKPKGSAHAVHAIRHESAQDGGTLVEMCSRTEGYDWRRAKRHATLQWVPEILPADVSQGTELADAKRAILRATDTERAHLVAAENPPTPCIGESHQDFLVTLNTFRYNEMLKSLWSIVTGRSKIHGIGLFTLSGYKKGDFVIEYAGDLIRTPLADIREARYEAAGLGTYLFKINDEQIVDATVQSNRARFTNHSCDPNMVADIVHVQGRDLIVLRATREIPKFTELTFDYKFPYEEAKVQCLCNAWNCVGVMN